MEYNQDRLEHIIMMSSRRMEEHYEILRKELKESTDELLKFIEEMKNAIDKNEKQG